MENDGASRRNAEQSMSEEEAAQQETLISSNSSTQSKPEPDFERHSARLHSSVYIVIITLGYICLATFAWVVTCLLTYKPIGARHYGFVALDSDNNNYGYLTPAQYHSLYESSEQYYRVARVVQSIVAVLTIPLTSAVCARAAIAFLQYGRLSRGMTMRQMMVLADKSWNDPGMIIKLLSGKWKRYGSSFLVGVALLNILGGILSPLQEIFLSTTVIKTPTEPEHINFLVDFSDHFLDLTKPMFDLGVATTLARGRLTSTRNTDPQMRLWSRAIDCNGLSQSSPSSEVCQLSGGRYTFTNMAWLNDPFWSQLPSGYSTGLIRQFAPRINSTAKRENITGDDFPQNCDQIPDALYIRYANETKDPLSLVGQTYAYSVEVCMPGNMSISPYIPDHRRNDFSEEMYLNISLSGFEQPQWQIQDGIYYSKITVDTTTGYFELPNYMNGEVAGQLLDDDPSNHCGLDCEPQGFQESLIYDKNLTSRDLSNTTDSSATNVTIELYYNTNKGPLLTTALALFGIGSFMTKLDSFGEYISSLNNGSLDGQCLDLVPFVSLLRDSLDHPGNSLDPCLNYNIAKFRSESLAATYLWAFIYDNWDKYEGERIQNAFTTAAFIANEAWMLGQPPSTTFSVAYDLGADTEVPLISHTGIVLISTLLCLFLVCLLALSLYSAWVPRWSTQLDAFAMMRIGAAMGDRLPLLLTRNVDRVKVLDETPGWIGDATGGEGPVGELAIGAETALRRRRKYRRYATG